MAWVRLDDQFPDHPKVVAAGSAAGWLFVCGLAYCSRYLTDGYIPKDQVRRLADVGNAQKHADALVRVGLWERTEGGYRVHDYLDYNPSKERVLATREARASAGSVGGKQKSSNLLAARQAAATDNDATLTKQNLTPSPSPTHLLDESSKERGANAPSAAGAADIEPPPDRLHAKEQKEPTGFAAFWTAYPKKEGRAKALEVWKRIKPPPAQVQEILDALEAHKQTDKWQRGFVMEPTRWLRERRWEDEVDVETPGMNGQAAAGAPLYDRNGHLTAAGLAAKARELERQGL